MRPDNKSESFTFHKNVFSSNGHSKLHCRRKLQDKFEKDQETAAKNDKSVLSVLTLNDTRKVLRSSAEKISKTFSNVRTSIGNFSQRFKSSTRRRQILEEGPMTPNCSTPRVRSILGRTPTKLYSPFGIETPKTDTAQAANVTDKENLPPPSKKLEWPRKKTLLDDVC